MSDNNSGASGWGNPPSHDGWGPVSASGSGWGAPPATTNIDQWGKPAAPAPQKKPADSAAPTNGSSSAGVDEVARKVEKLSTEDKAGEGAANPDENNEPVAKKHTGLRPDVDGDEIEVKLADLEKDVKNPLYSGVSTFEDLGIHKNLLTGIYAMGFQRPSKIQEKALPLLLSNPPRNMIGQSQSGTGKTAAFVLTMLSRVAFENPATQALCLAPARELARQIMDNVREMGKYTPVTTAFAIKDSVPRGQKVNAQIVIGTPGTVTELIKRRALDVSNLRIFVLDEADNMLDQQGLGDQSIRVKNMVPRNCQIVLFSATFTTALRSFAARFAPNANLISLRQEELSVEGIKQFYMDCRNEEHKVEVLQAIYGLLTIGQSIIFVRRRDMADKLSQRMREQGHTTFVLHGKLDTVDRDQVIDDYRNGKFKVLITTNVLARGIDILQVNLVINFDLPLDAQGRPDPETYLHRIGRTGRFGRTGVSINFVHDKRSFEEMKEIERHFGREITRVPTDNYMDIEKHLKKAVR
ncbi:RNA helicase required for poly(A+) mRNA export [Quaeritorhiza haematococci]|nr:RNA helicase required for poly(A+) mRNA export [Quaeritorhiza haematococci]